MTTMTTQLTLVLLTVLAYGLGMLSLQCRALAAWRSLIFVLAWGLHAVTLGVLAGPSLQIGFVSVLSITAWGVLSFYALEARTGLSIPLGYQRLGLAGLIGSVLLAWYFPGVSVALLNVGLEAHTLFGIAAYICMASAALHAWLLSRTLKQLKTAPWQAETQHNWPMLKLERFMFAWVLAAWVLLGATLVSGGLMSYPLTAHLVNKLLLTLLSFLVLSVLLLSRMRYGLRGQRAIRLVYGAAALLLFAYAGSRFVAEVL